MAVTDLRGDRSVLAPATQSAPRRAEALSVPAPSQTAKRAASSGYLLRELATKPQPPKVVWGCPFVGWGRGTTPASKRGKSWRRVATAQMPQSCMAVKPLASRLISNVRTMNFGGLTLYLWMRSPHNCKAAAPAGLSISACVHALSITLPPPCQING